MADKNLYDILGVSKGATGDEIKSAYRNLAKQFHPDKFSTKPDAERKSAEEKFKQISHAYDVLSDDQKKAAYDQYGSEDGTMGGFGGGFGSGGNFGGGVDDILSNLFGGMFGGGSRRSQNSRVDGEDITVSITIDFKEAAFGIERDIRFAKTERCNSCNGTGADKGTSYKTCSKCNGQGYVNYTQRTPFGTTSRTAPCDKCGGTGKEITTPCSSCGGKGFIRRNVDFHISVPAGVDNGQMLSYSGEGDSGKNGGVNGNLVIVVNVKPHNLFKRKGYDLYLEYPITFTQAALGAKISVPTLDGAIDFEIPAGTQHGQTFKIKNKGVKYVKRELKGDLYFTVVLEIPIGLSKKQRNLLTEFDTALARDQYPKCKKFNDTKI